MVERISMSRAKRGEQGLWRRCFCEQFAGYRPRRTSLCKRECGQSLASHQPVLHRIPIRIANNAVGVMTLI
jgi:hypothetical protein